VNKTFKALLYNTLWSFANLPSTSQLLCEYSSSEVQILTSNSKELKQKDLAKKEYQEALDLPEKDGFPHYSKNLNLYYSNTRKN
jgi:hypothetical protein